MTSTHKEYHNEEFSFICITTHILLLSMCFVWIFWYSATKIYAYEFIPIKKEGESISLKLKHFFKPLSEMYSVTGPILTSTICELIAGRFPTIFIHIIPVVMIVHYLSNHWTYIDKNTVVKAIAAVDETMNCAITLLLLFVLVGLDDDALLFVFVLW